eukprot:gene604-40187_t
MGIPNPEQPGRLCRGHNYLCGCRAGWAVKTNGAIGDGVCGVRGDAMRAGTAAVTLFIPSGTVRWLPLIFTRFFSGVATAGTWGPSAGIKPYVGMTMDVKVFNDQMRRVKVGDGTSEARIWITQGKSWMVDLPPPMGGPTGIYNQANAIIAASHGNSAYWVECQCPLVEGNDTALGGYGALGVSRVTRELLPDVHQWDPVIRGTARYIHSQYGGHPPGDPFPDPLEMSRDYSGYEELSGQIVEYQLDGALTQGGHEEFAPDADGLGRQSTSHLDGSRFYLTVRKLEIEPPEAVVWYGWIDG